MTRLTAARIHRVVAQFLIRNLLAERERWALWLPVAIGTGVGAYFALPSEPPMWSAWAVLAFAASLGLVGRRTHWGIFALALSAACAGFIAAQWRAHDVAAPVLERRLASVVVTGQLAEIEPMPDGARLLLQAVTIGKLAQELTPERVRVRARGRDVPGAVRVGDRLRMRATLSPPAPPAAPGAFDFQRHAWFMRLGAVGFSYGQPEILPSPGKGSAGGWRRAVEQLRHAVYARVTAALAGETGAVAAALMMGERGAIPADALAAMRDSGLAHLLAISGLHIGLMAGLAFFAVRGGLALVPEVALRRPIKKWAALAALAAAFAYLMVAGAPVPTQRSFVMAGLVLLAVCIDRTGISMRLVAWAAAAILLVRPESLLGASFQMSFAAVIALIAAYELAAERLGAWRRGAGPARRMALYLAAVALTSLVAGLATGPIALHQFNRVVVYGLGANMVAVPLTALWVMPWAMVAFLSMPLGLESWALVPMGWGIDGVLSVARTVAAWPGAVVLAPSLPSWGFLICVAGGLWLCLWRRPWRLAGGVAILAGLASVTAGAGPDLLISGNGRLVAVRGADGVLMVSRRSDAFVRETWLRRDATDTWLPFPAEGLSADGRLACDRLGCLYRAGGRVIALVGDERALAEDCLVADVLISAVPVRGDLRRGCRRPGLLIDRFDLWRSDAHALWLDGDKVRVESVGARRGRRPWTPRRGRQ